MNVLLRFAGKMIFQACKDLPTVLYSSVWIIAILYIVVQKNWWPVLIHSAFTLALYRNYKERRAIQSYPAFLAIRLEIIIVYLAFLGSAIVLAKDSDPFPMLTLLLIGNVGILHWLYKNSSLHPNTVSTTSEQMEQRAKSQIRPEKDS